MTYFSFIDRYNLAIFIRNSLHLLITYISIRGRWRKGGDSTVVGGGNHEEEEEEEEEEEAETRDDGKEGRIAVNRH